MDEIRRLVALADEALGALREAIDAADDAECTDEHEDPLAIAVDDMQAAITDYQQAKGWI